MQRNTNILNMLLGQDSNIICLQEFWHQSPAITELYHKGFGAAKYNVLTTPRTGGRGDGLLTAVSQDYEVIDKQDVRFNDCGDRVAMVLVVRSLPMQAGVKDVIVVNTHLMFPHNSNSTLIRLREVFKILEYLQQYRTRMQLSHLPIVMCGDFNGTPNGHVYRFLRSQGFVSTYEEHRSAAGASSAHCWVTHLNHHKELVGVDYIWLLNPSSRVEPLTCDWRKSVLAMVMVKLVENGFTTREEAFRFFDRDRDTVVSEEDLKGSFEELGMTGEGTMGLMSGEIHELHMEADKDGNGIVDFQEFAVALSADSMASAYSFLKEKSGISEGTWRYGEYSITAAAPTCAWPPPRSTQTSHTSREGDLEIVSSELPSGFDVGDWPATFHLSDHAPLTSTLRPAVRAPSVESTAADGADGKQEI
mmetsp:Transcript_9011/g.25891  ORF Transcript_9011/g.25891 Transcript_9011/m.25891 type:complete len:418 (-) Transcript_9011:159-1412(-)